MKQIALTLLFLLLAACGSDAPEAAAPVVSVATVPPAPISPSPTPVARGPVAETVTAGQTADGAFFRGNPDAAVTVTDYSDFL